jgi:predicted nicotinamide N-methyase
MDLGGWDNWQGGIALPNHIQSHPQSTQVTETIGVL